MNTSVNLIRSLMISPTAPPRNPPIIYISPLETSGNFYRIIARCIRCLSYNYTGGGEGEARRGGRIARAVSSEENPGIIVGRKSIWRVVEGRKGYTYNLWHAISHRMKTWCRHVDRLGAEQTFRLFYPPALSAFSLRSNLTCYSLYSRLRTKFGCRCRRIIDWAR